MTQALSGGLSRGPRTGGTQGTAGGIARYVAMTRATQRQVLLAPS